MAMRRVAHLFGVTSVEIEKSKILEIGCGNGVNLVSLGLLHPAAFFTGIDEDSAAIATAVGMAKELGTTNVRFITSTPEKFEVFGEYDYVMSPALFSSAGPKERDGLFNLMASALSEIGLALVGYSTYPGCGASKTFRDMMRLHTKHMPDRATKILEARKLLTFLRAANEKSVAVYGDALDREEILSNVDDNTFFQIYLDDRSKPEFFVDFMGAARTYGFNYVGDVEFERMYLGNYPDLVREQLVQIDDIILKEQYFDFVTNRSARNTILTRGQTADRDVPRERFEAYRYRLGMFPSEPISEKHYREDSVTLMVPGAKESGATITGKEIISCIEVLNERYPQLLSKQEILAEIEKLRERADAPGPSSFNLERTREACDALIARGVLAGIVVAELEPNVCVREAGERPKLFALARYQSRQQLRINNALHQLVEIAEVDQKLMPLLDGEKLLVDVVDVVEEWVEAGILNIRLEEGENGTDTAVGPEVIRILVEERLAFYARNALLVG